MEKLTEKVVNEDAIPASEIVKRYMRFIELAIEIPYAINIKPFEEVFQQARKYAEMANENASLKATLDNIEDYCESQNPADGLGWLSCASVNGVKRNVLRLLKAGAKDD